MNIAKNKYQITLCNQKYDKINPQSNFLHINAPFYYFPLHDITTKRPIQLSIRSTHTHISNNNNRISKIHIICSISNNTTSLTHDTHARLSNLYAFFFVVLGLYTTQLRLIWPTPSAYYMCVSVPIYTHMWNFFLLFDFARPYFFFFVRVLYALLSSNTLLIFLHILLHLRSLLLLSMCVRSCVMWKPII